MVAAFFSEKRLAALITLVATVLAAERAEAGPPLAIDDPGILDPGQWELILATDGIRVEDSDAYNLPLLDVSYGLTANTQASFSVPRLVLDVEGERERSGLGFATLGYKWRFLKTEHTEWAVAPAYAMPASHDVIRKNGPEDIRIFSLPLLYQRSIQDWTVLAQLAWNLGSNGEKAWDYGIALTRPLSDRIEGMVELFGVASGGLDYETLNYHLGIDFAVTDDFHILGSFGDRLKTNSGFAERLDFRYYLGLQWFY